MSSTDELVPTALVDTTVAIAALGSFHPAHDMSLAAVDQHHAGIAEHAYFETYAVLTRLPAVKLSPSDALAAIDRMFTEHASLAPARARSVAAGLARADISGGAIYDALVAPAAVEAGLPLLTMDRRATRTYAVVGADIRFIG